VSFVTTQKNPSSDLTCSCGATAPAGSLFCPMCAHPLSHSPTATHQPKNRSQVTEPVAKKNSITWTHADVIKSCYPSAVLAALFGSLFFYLFFLTYPTAGVFSVHNYRRRTAEQLQTNDGVRLGFVTGVLSFLVSLVMSTLVILIAGDPTIFAEAIRQEVQSMSVPVAAQQQMLDFLQSPMALSFMVLFSLAMSLTAAIVLSIIGGVIGTKILSRN